MDELILMTHVLLGVFCLVATVWLFVDTLHASVSNLSRIKCLSRVAAVSMWLAFLVGGYWYVTQYPADKAIILKGPWPFAHNFFMETKEHLVILLLLLTTYLPIAAADNLANSKSARSLLLCVAGLVVLLDLAMEGEGAFIAMGVKVGLLGKS